MNIKIVYAIVAAILATAAVVTACGSGYSNITPCNAIDISLTNPSVIAFLDSTNMATPSVHNCKNYRGYNTWMVTWHTETQLQKIYVDIYTGAIVGTGPEPEQAWHVVAKFQGRRYKVTPTFTIKGDLWRMVWKAKTSNLENDSDISVIVYKELLFTTWVDGFTQNTFPFGTGTYCVYEGAGTYKLDIAANKLEYWAIQVEDYY